MAQNFQNWHYFPLRAPSHCQDLESWNIQLESHSEFYWITSMLCPYTPTGESCGSLKLCLHVTSHWKKRHMLQQLQSPTPCRSLGEIQLEQRKHTIIWAAYEKPVFGGFQPGPTQAKLYNHITWLEAWNLGFRKKRHCTINVAKSKALISCAVTVQRICAFVFADATRSGGNSAGI